MKKKNCILGEQEDLKKRQDSEWRKRKIFYWNGGRNRWMRKNEGKKKKKDSEGDMWI